MCAACVYVLLLGVCVCMCVCACECFVESGVSLFQITPGSAPTTAGSTRSGGPLGVTCRARSTRVDSVGTCRAGASSPRASSRRRRHPGRLLRPGPELHWPYRLHPRQRHGQCRRRPLAATSLKRGPMSLSPDTRTPAREQSETRRMASQPRVGPRSSLRRPCR